MGLGFAGEFQLGQCGQHKEVRSVRRADDFVDANGRRGERFTDCTELGGRLIGVVRIEEVCEGFIAIGRGNALHRGENILGGFDQRGALFEEAVGAACARIKRGTGDGHHFAPLLESEPGSDEAAVAFEQMEKR